MTDNQKKMILDWMRKIHQLEYAHRYQSIYFSRLEKVIGISAFLLSTLIAFSYRFPGVDAAAFEKLPFFLKQDFFVPALSTIVAVLTGLHTFLKPSEKSELHKKTASNYEMLRHTIEVVINNEQTDKEFAKNTKLIKAEWDKLDAINVSNKFFLMGKMRVKSLNKYPEELSFLATVV